MLKRKKEEKQNSKMWFWYRYVVLNRNSKQSSQCSSQFILNSLKGALQRVGYSIRVVLVNKYDEILWKCVFCEAEWFFREESVKFWMILLNDSSLPGKWSFPGLTDLFLNLTIYIVLFTFVQGRTDFRWGNAKLLTCKYLENLAYSSLGKMEGYICKIEKHYCMATHLMRWGYAL